MSENHLSRLGLGRLANVATPVPGVLEGGKEMIATHNGTR